MMQFLLLGALILAPKSGTPNEVRIVLALVLILSGAIGFLIAARDLGSALTPMPEAKDGAPFVTSGIYRRLRHPIYSFLLLIGIGIVIYKKSFEAVAIWGGLFALLNLKYRYEDRFLRDKWPEAATYQGKVPALFPKMRTRPL